MICPKHNRKMTDQHTGPEDLLLCKECVDEDHAARKAIGYEEPSDEMSESHVTAKNWAVAFAGDGRMVDQAYQARLPEGMVRCYLVGDKVEGFGLQEVVALCPPRPGEQVEAGRIARRHFYDH